jgi:Tol biopolymer transport system component
VPPGPWIVFHSDPVADSRLSLIRPDGSDLTLLTDTVAGYPFGEWSPDGSRVAFLSGSFGEGALLVIDADGSGESHVTEVAARPPEWSPDGANLVFEAVEGGIFSVGADGSGLVEIASDGHGPMWSPDGTRIVFFAEVDANVDVFVMTADGSNRSRVTSDPAEDVSPAWAPTGDRIAFVSERHDNTDLYVIDPDGRHEVRLTDDPLRMKPSRGTPSTIGSPMSRTGMARSLRTSASAMRRSSSSMSARVRQRTSLGTPRGTVTPTGRPTAPGSCSRGGRITGRST